MRCCAIRHPDPSLSDSRIVSLQAPEKLTLSHVRRGFACGYAPFDEWLTRYAISNDGSGTSRTFVTTDRGVVKGYYALVAGAVEHDFTPVRAAKAVPQQPIPVIVLSRLAVHKDHQGRGVAKALLRDAFLRVDQAADFVGIRALLVHVKDEAARDFYLRLAEFEESPTDPSHLFLPMAELHKALRS